ncbi:MAG: helix-turn-helix transcriptional regulator [Gemmiger sp.]|uniref:helix-turn-helix domain-containing protein n=3 Tax=Gemmiger sp. TaxID=2049027 RepID=UPI002A90A61C|nr:helix-turn-helix transcriptional regulator [Gemmiger sp.]MCI6384965.1 helix-turn-helix domain-containing protein [Subdoligranulum variabile]MDD6650481.1 helix-turn-helix transcriptional regulator [Subdoligranulum variabile]MDY5503023.1 helix-turn-helix transcriptional regulator [Gemmiger sp.]
MIFADKLIALRKKSGWSQEELAEKLGVTRQSVSKWEGAQSVPDIDKILQLSHLFGVTTDYLLKDELGEPEYTAGDDAPALRKVTLAQANDYLTQAHANAPKMALATALCVLSPVPLIALGALAEYGYFRADFATGLGLCTLLVLVAVAVVLFMQCGAAVKPYEFLEKEPIDTEYGVTGLAHERRDAFAVQYNRGNTLGTVLCILCAVPLFAAMMFLDTDILAAAAVCLLLVLVACGVYAFVRVGTVQDALNQLLEEGDFTRDAKARKGAIRAVAAAYWLVVVAIFLFYTFGPYGNGQPEYSWFIWAIAGVIFAAVMVVMKAVQRHHN